MSASRGSEAAGFALRGHAMYDDGDQAAWHRRVWQNVPGPFFTTDDNSLAGGPLKCDEGTPPFLMHDGNYEWYARQPCTRGEVRRWRAAAYQDPTGSHHETGNRFWTPTSLREWVARRQEIVAWVDTTLPTADGTLEARRAGCYVQVPDQLRWLREHILTGCLPRLRRYAFWLAEGRMPASREPLPAIE